MSDPLTITATIYPNEVVAAFGLLLIISYGYDRVFVDPVVTKMNGSDGVVSWAVVIGVAYTLAIATIVMNSAAVGIVLFAMFVAAGIPMINGSYRRG